MTQTVSHSLANWDSCPTPAKSEGIEYLQIGPTEIRYSITWTIFVYLQHGHRKQKYSQIYNKYIVVVTDDVVFVSYCDFVRTFYSRFRCVQVRVPYLLYF